MFGSAILDVAIGMAVVYLLLSLIASVIQEGIAAVLQSRAANLLQGVHSLFSGDTAPNGMRLLEALYDHGLVRGLYRDPREDSGIERLRSFDKIRMALQNMLGLAPPTKGMGKISNRMLLPAYIPSRTFALALIDILDPAATGTDTDMNSLRNKLAAALIAEPSNKAMQALAALADSAGDDLAEFQRRIENWYNDAMDRVSGWYKKYTQKLLMAIGLVIAVAFNVNSIRVANTLWTDKDARQAMVALADQTIAQGNPTTSQAGGGTPAPKTPTELEQELEQRITSVQNVANKHLLPLGWTQGVYNSTDCRKLKLWKALLAAIGWCITALALSLGASFWFDTLNKFMVIRGTIKPDEKSQPEPSKG
jgi:hypothetical protein